MIRDHVDHVVDGSSWSKRKECCLQTPTCRPLYLFATPCLRLSFTGPYCSFVIMECNTPPTLRKEFPVSPAILLRSPSFLDALQVLCWTAHPLQGTQNTPVSNICTGPGEAVIQTKMSQGHIIIWWANNTAPLTPRGPYRISSVTIKML